MYGLVLGAEKSWSVKTAIDDAFYSRVNSLLFENENGMAYLKELSRMNDLVSWRNFAANYFEHRYPTGQDRCEDVLIDLREVQEAYKKLTDKLNAQQWIHDEYRQEMLISAEGICTMAELSCKLAGKPCERMTNAHQWLIRYKRKWLESNKKSELNRIEEMFAYCEEI